MIAVIDIQEDKKNSEDVKANRDDEAVTTTTKSSI